MVSAVVEARRFLSDAARASRVSTEVLEVVLLLGSELATNAVVHARTPFVVGMQVTGHQLRVWVADGDPRPPRVLEEDVTTPGGFGLLVVQRLAASWGVEEVPDGKVVWVEVQLDRP